VTIIHIILSTFQLGPFWFDSGRAGIAFTNNKKKVKTAQFELNEHYILNRQLLPVCGRKDECWAVEAAACAVLVPLAGQPMARWENGSGWKCVGPAGGERTAQMNCSSAGTHLWGVRTRPRDDHVAKLGSSANPTFGGRLW
jgi:hypothetical protein